MLRIARLPAHRWAIDGTKRATAQRTRAFASDDAPKPVVAVDTVTKPQAVVPASDAAPRTAAVASTNDTSSGGSSFKSIAYSLLGISLIGYSGAIYYASKDKDAERWMRANVPGTEQAIDLARTLSQAASSSVQTVERSVEKRAPTTPAPPMAKLTPQSPAPAPEKPRVAPQPNSLTEASETAAKDPPVPTAAPRTPAIATAPQPTPEPKKKDKPVATADNVRIVPAASVVDAKPAAEASSLVIQERNASIRSLTSALERLAVHFDALVKTNPSLQPSITRVRDIITSAKSDLRDLSSEMSLLTDDQDAFLNTMLHDSAESLKKALEQQRQKYEDSFVKQKQSMSEQLQHALDSERKFLESKHDQLMTELRTGSEKKLVEALTNQARELQGRWKRELQDRVEHERNGRLAKLDHLTLKLKYLERICVDNADKLHKSYHIHSLYSALQALHTTLFEEPGHDHVKQSFRREWELIRKLSFGDTLVTTALDTVPEESQVKGIESLPNLHTRFINRVAPEIRRASLLPTIEHTSVFSGLRSLVASFLPERHDLPAASYPQFALASSTPPVGFISYSLSRMLSALVVPKPPGIHHKDNDTESVLARVEYYLGREDLDSAARELNALTGWPKTLAKDWLAEARRHLQVRMAIEVLHTQVSLMSLGAV
ncbi:MICOS complex subunit mic60 [Sorochytrium milnesiophthora]